MWRTRFWAAALVLPLVGGALALAGGRDREFSPYVDATGTIALPEPETVRARWDYLGMFAVQGGKGVKEFHAVYTQPGTIDAYHESGEFPDGAVLVKEVRTASQGLLTTGEVAWSDQEASWFVMIKDREDRFPNNPIWAEQWGWALFRAEDRETNTSTAFTADCMGCHLPARETEWVFKQGYPVLRD